MIKKISLSFILCSNLLMAASPPPKLIVQLVVDQFRGDFIHQYQAEFGPNGFNYLLAHGVDFQNAHHPHALTSTCVGHATIATGSYPSLHGIIGNDWFSRHTKQEVYCVEDRDSKTLPTSRTKKELPGRSSRNLLASTLSDEILLSQKGRAFGVSLKDRAAITLAGHSGKAFWFDKENGGFVTSQHYYQVYPEWVNVWNNHYKPQNETWKLQNDIKTYRFAKSPIVKNNVVNFGDTFPHSTGEANEPCYYKYLSMTPYADELTADFATQLLKEEKLGRTPNKTDYLAISFSVVDAVGHQFGPNSLESEDAILRLDNTLAKLLKNIDKEVGLQNTLIVLTADHGVTDSAAYLETHQIHEVSEPNTQQLQKRLEEALVNQFGLPTNSLEAIRLPYVYLNHPLLSKHQLTMDSLNAKLVEVLNQQPGVFKAYSLFLTNTDKSWLGKKVNKMAFPQRSGDIYVVPMPYQPLTEKALRTDLVEHGTPWKYDSYVPLVFANPAFKAHRISKPVRTTDIAPTLAAILQIKEPSASTGQPLQAVMDYYE